MNQTERRLWLINYLLGEDERYRNIAVGKSEKEQFDLYRSLVNVRMPADASDEYLKIENESLQEKIRKHGITKIGDLSPIEADIYLWQGDITTLECDAIVNAANSQMLGCFQPLHACIDNCIHTYSGISLRKKCHEIMQAQGHPEPTGSAKITEAYNLPCKYVIHTVGPIVSSHLTDEHCRLLESCYRSCLEIAEQNGAKSIAFCCISTGVFGFPQDRAAEIAVDTVRAYKKETNSDIKIIFNVFKDEDKKIYEGLLG